MSVLEAVQPKLGEKFVDIGSGTGKAVLLAAALHPLRSCVGIEIVEPLHAVAVRAKEAFFQKLRELSQQGSSKREAGSTAAHDSEASCQLILGDCFDHTDEWRDADILYLPCTCFTEEMMQRLLALAATWKPTARVIATSRLLATPALRLERTMRARYKRGNLAFHIYRRVGHTQEEEEDEEEEGKEEEGKRQGEERKEEEEEGKKRNGGKKVQSAGGDGKQNGVHPKKRAKQSK